MKEKKQKVFQIILLRLSIAQIISAGVVFLVIIYFAIRALKYFKII